MSQRLARALPRAGSAADLLALVKPRILVMALITTAGGFALVPGASDTALLVTTLLGTALLVGAANTLNMYLERDIDGRMSRTRDRPLPAGRMDPGVALVFGVAQAGAAVPLLTFAVNPLTGLLGVIELLGYVLAYTPLKQRTTASTLVGAVPGAMPPLLGWTAASGSLDPGGLAVFGVLFLWQMPHFHAIAIFHADEYRNAGLKTVPGERGERAARVAIVGFLIPQVALSLALAPLGVAGTPYTVGAAVLGALYLGYAVAGARSGATMRWARRLFFLSILYLPALFALLVIDGAR